MLMAIWGGRVPGCAYGEEDIVHLVLRADQIHAAGLPYVFSTHHAVLALADFYESLTDLDKVDWDMFFDPPLLDKYSKWFHNPIDRPKYATRRESRQAEFLVHGSVPTNQVVGVGVFSEAKRQEVIGILARCGWQVPVRVKRDWYF
jgi:hypothetical protein